MKKIRGLEQFLCSKQLNRLFSLEESTQGELGRVLQDLEWSAQSGKCLISLSVPGRCLVPTGESGGRQVMGKLKEMVSYGR